MPLTFDPEPAGGRRCVCVRVCMHCRTNKDVPVVVLVGAAEAAAVAVVVETTTM